MATSAALGKTQQQQQQQQHQLLLSWKGGYQQC
jgi:hypothetical protein